MGGGRGDRMVLVDAAENPGRLGYQLCGPWPSILSYRAVLGLGRRACVLKTVSNCQNGSCCSGGGAPERGLCTFASLFVHT